MDLCLMVIDCGHTGWEEVNGHGDSWLGEAMWLDGSKAASGGGRCWEGVDGVLRDGEAGNWLGQGKIKGADLLSIGSGWGHPSGMRPSLTKMSHAEWASL